MHNQRKHEYEKLPVRAAFLLHVLFLMLIALI